MSEWKEYKLGEVLTFQRGYDLPKGNMVDGPYPVAGSNGIIGYHAKYTTKGPGITIGRSGNIGMAHYYPIDFWAHNTTLYVKDFKGNEPKFIYYLLKTIDFSLFNTGSAVPSLNRNHVHELVVSIPPLDEQKRIAGVLSSLDDKIDLLHRENATLEALAETLFRHYFIENPDSTWKEGKLGDVAIISAGGDKPEIVSSIRTEDAPVPVFSNGIEKDGLFGFTNKAKVFEESVTVSARGTIGFVALRTEPFVPIVRLITLVPIAPMTSKYLYYWAKLADINGTGTTQQQLTVPDFKETRLLLPNTNLIHEFTDKANVIHDKIKSNLQQMQTLASQRDGLLPRLMSDEVRIYRQ